MAVNFTNEHNIPQRLVDAITQDDHVTRGDISVTTLIDSPQVRILKKMNDYKMDVMSLIPAFMGTGLHMALERHDTSHRDVQTAKEMALIFKRSGNQKAYEFLNQYIAKELKPKKNDNIMKEVTLSVEIDGMVISGTFDYYDRELKRIEDYKMTKTYAWIYPEERTSWKKQLNIYAYMLRENGEQVESGIIHAFFKDWTASGRIKSRSYPDAIYKGVDIEILPQEDILKYIKSQVAKHKKAEETGKAVCTPKEKWEKAGTWKVLKTGRQSSMKNVPTEAMAKEFIESEEIKNPKSIGKMKAVYFPGESKRCEEFCPVNQFCNQYIIEKSQQNQSSEEL